MLTRDEKRVYEYICGRVGRGEGVSYREIVSAMGYGSVSTAAARVKSLEAKGFIIRDGRRSRSIRLTLKAETPKSTARVPMIDMERFRADKGVLSPENIVSEADFPLMGRAYDPMELFCVKIGGLKSENDSGLSNGDIAAAVKCSKTRGEGLWLAINDGRLTVSRAGGEALTNGLIVGKIIALIRWF